MIIDSHFHTLEIQKKGLVPEEFFPEDQKEFSFWGGLDVGICLDDLKERLNIVRRFPTIRLSLGLYPSEVEGHHLEEKLSRLEGYLEKLAWSRTRGPIVAVGECGLDLHWKYGSIQGQKDLFRAQILLSNQFQLPLIVHNRDATPEILDCFAADRPTSGGIMHCFSGSTDDARRFLDHGFYISFAGNLTYKKNEFLQTTMKTIPLDRLLLETDSPYLAPVPFRGRVNRPGYVRKVYDEAAKVLGIDFVELEAHIGSNFLRLFPGFSEG